MSARKKHCAAWLLTLTLLLNLLLCGCGGPKQQKTVLLVLGSQLDASYDELTEAAEAWAAEKELTLELAAPDYPTVSRQQAVLEDALERQSWDLIVIEPLSGPELYPLVDYAKQQGSVVVALQGAGTLGADYTVQPADYTKLGQDMMDELAELMGQSGSYATLVPSKQAPAVLAQELGSVDRQKSQYGGLLAVSRLQEAASATKTAEMLDSLYEAYELEGVLFYSYANGSGVARWKQANPDRDVKAVGLGDPAAMQASLDSGMIDTLFYWNRENLLTASLEVGYKAITNRIEADDDVITTGVTGYKTLRALGGGCYYGDDIQTVSS